MSDTVSDIWNVRHLKCLTSEGQGATGDAEPFVDAAAATQMRRAPQGALFFVRKRGVRYPFFQKEVAHMAEVYGIIRLAKTKGAAVHAAQYHNDRLPGVHSNPDIKPHLHELNQEFLTHGKYEDEIAERTKDLKRKVRKDAVVLVDGMMTASPEWFQNHSYGEAMAFFKDGLDFIQERFGKENVFYFTVHRDETTYHAHFGFTPIKDGSLSWKKFFPNRQALTKFQDQFYENVSSKYGMERGTKREYGDPVKRHKTVREFKAEKVKELDREIAERTERLEGLQDQEDELRDQVEDLERAVGAVEAGSVELTEVIGGADKASQIESQNRDLAARAEHLERGNQRLGARAEQLEQQVGRELDGLEERASQARSCRGQAACVEAETGRFEKAGSIIAGALEKGHAAVIDALTRLIRTDDLRRQDDIHAWSASKVPEFKAKRATVRVEPRGQGKIYEAIAKVETKLAELRLGIKMGLRPKDLGSYDRFVQRRDQLDSQTPEAITIARNYQAERRILSLCADIYECRGPRKEEIKASLAEIAKDETLGSRTRSTAESRIAWIDAGAPSGSPAGGNSGNPAARGHAAAQGGEARERSIGGDAR